MTPGRWFAVAITLGAWLGGAGASGAATVSSVQSGTASSTANGTLTVTITSVDTTKSMLIFQTRHSSNRPVGATVRGRIASATTLEFVRSTDEVSPATINIQWYVVSYASGVKVQRGEFNQSSATTNVTITAVAAVAQCFVTWSKTTINSSNAYNDDDPVVGELTSTTNLQFRGNATTGHTVSWQVVEYTSSADIAVQKGTTSMSGTTTSVTATLSPAVDVNRTFVLVGYRAAGTGSDMGARMVRAQLTNSTTVTIDRTTAGFPVAAADAWTTGLTHSVGAGSNRLLVFAVGYENATDTLVSSVSYGGQAMTRITGTSATSTGVYNRAELWYLKESGIAAASSTTFSVTWGGGAPTDPMYAAGAYTGVDQTTPIADSSSNSTTAATPNPLTTNLTVLDREMSVGVAISGNTGTYSWGNSWTEDTDQTSGATTNLSTAHHAETASATATASATHSGPNRQVVVAAALAPAAVNSTLPEIAWQAIELKDGSTVESGSANFPAATAQVVTALSTPVNTNTAIALGSAQACSGQNSGRTSYTGDDTPGVASATVSLSGSAVTLDRNDTSADADVAWFVLQFKPKRVMVVRRWGLVDAAPSS